MSKDVSRTEFDESTKKLFRMLAVWSGEGLRTGQLDEAVRKGAQARVRTGHIAALKRGLRSQGSPVPAVAWVIEPFIPEDWPTESSKYQALYQAALLYALHPFSDPKINFQTNTGAITHAFLRANGGQRIGGDETMQANDRRINLLLDAGRHELFNRLRQVMPALLNNSDEGVHWVQLAKDLRDWESPRQTVQQRWARGWFGGPKFMSPAPTEPQEEDQTAD